MKLSSVSALWPFLLVSLLSFPPWVDQEPVFTASIPGLVNGEYAHDHDGFINAFSDDPTAVVIEWRIGDAYALNPDLITVELRRPSRKTETHVFDPSGVRQGEMKLSLIPESDDDEDQLPEEGIYHWKAVAYVGDDAIEMGSGAFEVNYTAASVVDASYRFNREDLMLQVELFSDMALIAAEYLGRSNISFNCTIDERSARKAICTAVVPLDEITALNNEIVKVTNYVGNTSLFRFRGEFAPYQGSVHVGYAPIPQNEPVVASASEDTEITPCFNYNGMPAAALFDLYAGGNRIASYSIYATYSKIIRSNGTPVVRIESIEPISFQPTLAGVTRLTSWQIHPGTGIYISNYASGWWQVMLGIPINPWHFTTELDPAVPYLKFRAGSTEGKSFSYPSRPFSQVVIGGSIRVDAPSGQCMLVLHH